MPRKIKVENLNDLPESEAMTEVREEMKEEAVAEPAVEVTAEPAPKEEEVIQPKPKRAPRKKKEEVAPKEEEVAPKEEEVIQPKPKRAARKKKEEEVIERVPTPEPEAPSKVSCPDCGKMVSAKTLKYSHKANCKANKKEDKAAEVHTAVVYEERAPLSQRELRNQLRQQRLENLVKDAF